MAVTEKSYVDSQSAVKKARSAVQKANAALADAQKALDNTPENLKDLVKSNTDKLNAAKKALADAKTSESSAVATATQYYKANKTKIEADAAKGQSDPEKLAALKEARDRAKAAGVSTAAYDGQIKELENKIANPPKASTDTGDTGTGGDGTKVKYRDYAKEISTAGKYIAKLAQTDKQQLIALANGLKNAGYNVPTDGTYSDALITGYIQAIADNQTRSQNYEREIPMLEFLNLRKGEGGAGTTGTGGPQTTLYPTITSEQDAKPVINKFFQDKLGRDATDAEFKAAYAAVKKDQEVNVQKQVVTTDAKGNKVYKTTGGPNTEQALTDYVNKNKTLKSELDAYAATDTFTNKRKQDKTAYDKMFAAAANDPAKLAKLSTTAYGKDLAKVRLQLENKAVTAGAKLTAEELDAIAKEAIDLGKDASIYELSDFLDSKLKFGADEKGVFKGKAGETVADLAKIAAANGLDLQKAFGSQLPDWLNAINKGESIETYKKMIREVAKIGMPEKIAKLMDQGIDLSTIYSPYKNMMASTLEINPQSITLDDPTLRAAITSDKEIPLYDFERALRKDDRWQYTNRAREEVSNAAQKILKDFGFMG